MNHRDAFVNTMKDLLAGWVHEAKNKELSQHDLEQLTTLYDKVKVFLVDEFGIKQEEI